MLKFESFGLPTDGLTRVAEFDYYGKDLHKQGWCMVGMTIAKTDSENEKLYGVYRMTSDQALEKSLNDVITAEKKQTEAESAKYHAEQDVKKLKDMIADMAPRAQQADKMEKTIAELREKFGSEIVNEIILKINNEEQNND